MLEETLKTFLSTSTSLLGVVVTYLLAKDYCSPNGSVQIKGRIWSRCTSIHFMRIEESRDYLDTFLCAFRTLRQLQSPRLLFVNHQDRGKLHGEIAGLMDVARKKRFHLRSLSDSQLMQLDEELMKVVNGNYTGASAPGPLGQSEPAFDETFLERLSDEYPLALALIRRMEARLDQLSQMLP